MPVAAKKKGIALAIALAVSAVLFVLGLTYLSFVGRDYFLTGKSYADLQAYYLAESCLDYYANTGLAVPTGQAVVIFPGMDAARYSCLVLRAPSGALTFQGRVTNEVGSLVSVKTITVP